MLRRRIRVEAVLKGHEPGTQVDLYEAYWFGAATGDWNLTRTGARYLFLARMENDRYRLVRDWRRCVYEVNSGRHTRLPLDDSRPLWERVGLMTWWVQPDHDRAFGTLYHADPGNALSTWRTIKILRGLLRHPERRVRLSACETLFHWGDAQDECWDDLVAAERSLLNRRHNMIPPEAAFSRNRRFEGRVEENWAWARSSRSPGARDELRLFTTIRDDALRRRFCGLYQQDFPDDTEHGCPADQPRPATIVTEAGDVPLAGSWPVP